MTASVAEPSPPRPRGNAAESPWQIPLAGWWDVLVRTWNETGKDNVGLIAAGVAFYGFLALVPLLGALVLSYGLVADPETVIANVRSMMTVMPADAAKLVGEQLMNVVQTSGGKKGFGLLLALALAVFGARNAAGSIVTALNIAYEEREKRGFIWVNLLALIITAAGVVVAVLAVIAIAALGHLQDLLHDVPDLVVVAGKLLSYVVLALVGAAGAATLYRYGPSRRQARWVWLTPGSIFASMFWLGLTFGFGLYVANFGNYNATYGSLGAVVILLTWLYLSSYVLLFGAELNAELEFQTTHDTTRGQSRPPGKRGAWVADHAVGLDPPGPTVSPPVSHTPIEPMTYLDRTSSSVQADYLTSRATSRIVQLAGTQRIGMLASGCATVGLALIRKRGRASQGLALLSVAAGVSYLSRQRR